MSNRHYIKGLIRRRNRHGLGRATGLGEIEKLIKQEDEARAKVRPEDLQRAQKAAARQKKDEMARLVQQDMRRRRI